MPRGGRAPDQFNATRFDRFPSRGVRFSTPYLLWEEAELRVVH